MLRSGDLLTPAPRDPEALSTRNLPRGEIGDFCVIEGAGAYCSSMAAAIIPFPKPRSAPQEDGRLYLIHKRQTFDQIIERSSSVKTSVSVDSPSVSCSLVRMQSM